MHNSFTLFIFIDLSQTAAIAGVLQAIEQSQSYTTDLARFFLERRASKHAASMHQPSRYRHPVGVTGSGFKDFAALARAVRDQTASPGLFQLIAAGKSIGVKGYLLDAKSPQAAQTIALNWTKLNEGAAKADGPAGIQWGSAEVWVSNGKPPAGTRLLCKGVDTGISEKDFTSEYPNISGFYRHVDKKGNPTSFVFFNVPEREQALKMVEQGMALPQLLIRITDVQFASERQLVGYCYNCLTIGCHSSRCKVPQACAYCKGSHFRRDCPVKESDEVVNARVCVNCGSKDHWGDDRSCPKLIRKPSARSPGPAAMAAGSYAKAVAAKTSAEVTKTKAVIDARIAGLEARLAQQERHSTVFENKLASTQEIVAQNTLSLGAHLKTLSDKNWKMPQVAIDACFATIHRAQAQLNALNPPGNKRSRDANAQQGQ